MDVIVSLVWVPERGGGGGGGWGWYLHILLKNMLIQYKNFISKHICNLEVHMQKIDQLHYHTWKWQTAKQC